MSAQQYSEPIDEQTNSSGLAVETVIDQNHAQKPCEPDRDSLHEIIES